MTLLDWITAIASTATAMGVIIAVIQIWHAGRIASSEFEDEMQKEYRGICAELPVKVFLGDELTGEELEASIGFFHRYFHLTNSQIFLRQQGRVSAST